MGWLQEQNQTFANYNIRSAISNHLLSFVKLRYQIDLAVLNDDAMPIVKLKLEWEAIRENGGEEKR